jgi:hypothetical protein
MTTVDPVRDADEHQVRLTEREALANVRTVLELCAAGELRCSDKTNRPTAATMRTIDAHLVHGVFYAEERIAAVAWPLLVQAGGLAKLDGTRLQLARKGRAALENPPAETIRHLWRRWLTHAVIDEFSRIEQIKGQRARNVLTAAKPRRQTVAVALADCPPRGCCPHHGWSGGRSRLAVLPCPEHTRDRHDRDGRFRDDDGIRLADDCDINVIG